MKRRIFVQGTVAIFGLGLSSKSWGLGKDSQLDVAEVMAFAGALSRPSSWERGLFEVNRSTSIDSNSTSVQVSPEKAELFAHPFSVMIGTDEFEPLSELAIENLRRYLIYGGFLLLDDASGRKDSGFRKSVRRMAKRIFPTQSFLPLPADHSIYRSFFLLQEPAGRIKVSDQMEGVKVGSIWPLMYCANDLSGALERTDSGGNKYPVIPDGEYQRTESIKLMINLAMYALTSNYKHDQAHVAELLRRGDL
jgi:hypothetical protein